jgi:hypothetical protein
MDMKKYLVWFKPEGGYPSKVRVCAEFDPYNDLHKSDLPKEIGLIVGEYVEDYKVYKYILTDEDYEKK